MAMKAYVAENGLKDFIDYLDTTNRTVWEMQKALEVAGYFYSYDRARFMEAAIFVEYVKSRSELCHPWDKRRQSDAQNWIKWLEHEKRKDPSHGHEGDGNHFQAH
jgi:hypothetical protein